MCASTETAQGCQHCAARDEYIAKLQKVNKALRIALENGKASLEAQGRSLKKAEAEAAEALKRVGG